nr:60S ribosomal protein L14A [Cryptomonas curvata]|mmetsp:Transcript_50589/g.105678  ORF Transcript_50589/g.105678 Transcript_50589/m.105678 type:complete len:124 (-) Transcript_50589:353-724(-)
MQFKRFIEVGRIITVNFGPSRGKIGVIVDLIDKNRCIIDGWTGRQVINNKRMILTRTLIKINRSMSSKKIKEELNKNTDLINKFNESVWFQKNHLKKKRSLFNDFDCFKHIIGKKNKKILFSC